MAAPGVRPVCMWVTGSIIASRYATGLPIAWSQRCGRRYPDRVKQSVEPTLPTDIRGHRRHDSECDCPAESQPALPGPYMLLVINGSGMPSEARMVTVGP
ncbi:MAG: galactose oxidase-like domain-containing protein [Gemmatimonadales bacterium]